MHFYNVCTYSVHSIFVHVLICTCTPLNLICNRLHLSMSANRSVVANVNGATWKEQKKNQNICIAIKEIVYFYFHQFFTRFIGDRAENKIQNEIGNITPFMVKSLNSNIERFPNLRCRKIAYIWRSNDTYAGILVVYLFDFCDQINETANFQNKKKKNCRET